MNPYEEILRARMDMTQWLIHFTRGRDSVSPRNTLLSIARDGAIRPSWSERSSRRTIYGPRPCVCFTEQPLSGFAEYARLRRDGLVSGYGVLVHKSDVFADGGRPVIYGGEASEISKGESAFVAGQRTLSVLPASEQYRYVAFNPNAPGGPIDWTHEREWRWPQGARTPDPDSLIAAESGAFLLAGSGVASGDGMSRGRSHLLVERDADIEWMQAQLSSNGGAKPTSDLSHHLKWRYKLASSVGLFSLETVGRELKARGPTSESYGRLETWPRDLSVALAAGGSLPARDVLDR